MLPPCMENVFQVMTQRRLMQQSSMWRRRRARGKTRGSLMKYSPTKRMWKRLAIGAVMLFGIALIANGFFGWWVERQLQSRIDAMRAAGDPASIAELKPEPVPSER